MPILEHHGASIYYEVHGEGFPILTFAPAGLLSKISVWSGASAPMNPVTEWSKDFKVIVMDQRNAGGQSKAPIKASDGWHSFAEDHIALLDHLKVAKCHLFGQCIGGSFIFSMLKLQPQRVASAVIAQAIGRVGPLKPGRSPRFDEWAKGLKDHPEATEPVLDSFYNNLYASGFVYSADRDFVKSVRTPCMVLYGNDDAHPYPISDEIAKLLPNNEAIVEWKTGAALEAVRPKVLAFFKQHTPR